MSIQEFDQEIQRLEHNTKFLRLESELLERRRKALEDRKLIDEEDIDCDEYQATIVACLDCSLFLFDKYALNVDYGNWTTSPITSVPNAFILYRDQTFWDTSLPSDKCKGNVIKLTSLISDVSLDESYNIVKDYLKWGPALW